MSNNKQIRQHLNQNKKLKTIKQDRNKIDQKNKKKLRKLSKIK